MALLPQRNAGKRSPVSSSLLYGKDRAAGGIRDVRLRTSTFVSASLRACTSFSNDEVESQQRLRGDCPPAFLLAVV